jgi:hypothetical protein
MQCLGRLRRLWTLPCVLLVHFRLALRALGLALPIPAQLVLNQVERRQVRPFGSGKLLHHPAHEFFVHLGPQCWIALLSRGSRAHVLGVELPLDVGRPIQGLRRQRRIGEELGYLEVEAKSVAVRTPTPAATAGLPLRVRRLAKQNTVAIGGGIPHHTFIQDPATDISPLPQIGKHVQPPAGLLDDHHLAPATHAAKLLHAGIRTQVEHRLAHQDAALSL